MQEYTRDRKIFLQRKSIETVYTLRRLHQEDSMRSVACVSGLSTADGSCGGSSSAPVIVTRESKGPAD